MTQRERQEHAKKTIFQAALAEFGAQPYETVTMDRICSRHGISKGMMYHYFSSKDELFLLCVKELFQSLQVYIQEESTQIQKKTVMPLSVNISCFASASLRGSPHGK